MSQAATTAPQALSLLDQNVKKANGTRTAGVMISKEARDEIERNHGTEFERKIGQTVVTCRFRGESYLLAEIQDAA